MQDVDTIFIDNRKGILPGYLAKRLTGSHLCDPGLS